MVEKLKRKRTERDEAGDNKKSLLSKSAEISFPRGGGSVLTPLEIKEVANEAVSDALAEAKESKASKKSKKQKAVVAPTEQIEVEHVTFKTLLPGSMVLGQIKQVNRMEIVLSLMDNLMGFIPITNISDALASQLQEFDDEQDESDEEPAYGDDEDTFTNGIISSKKKSFPQLVTRFQVGQWLRAVVVESTKSKKKRIELSIEPSKVNEPIDNEDLVTNAIIQASVKSVEDHGLVLDVGKEKTGGFIAKKDVQSLVDVGSVLLVNIARKDGRTLICTPVNKLSVVQTISSIDAILPGMGVEALVTAVTKEGVICKLFGVGNASIPLSHLGVYEFSELKHKFAVGSKLKSRVMVSYLRAGDKRFLLSVLPHVKSLNTNVFGETSALEAFPIGHIFDSVRVRGKDSSYIYVDVGSDLASGQAHITRVSSTKDLDMDFKIGSTHRARVLGFSATDNLYILTLDKQQIERKFLRVEDIPAGELVNCEVRSVDAERGIVVKFEEDFEGIVPPAYMSDVKLIYPERKFKIGSKMKGRVLRVVNQSGKSRIYVTLKKSLVNIEDEDVISSIDHVEAGKKTLATIDKMLPTGCVVRFFGFVKAFLPNSEISETFVKRPEDHVKLGQTVKVRVVSVDRENNRIKVSCRVSEALSDMQKKTLSSIVPGRSIVDVQVVEKEKDSAIVELTESGLRGIIYAGHLGEGNYEQSRAQLKKLQIGAEIKTLVLEKDVRSRVVKLSAKESLIKDAQQGKLPLQYRDIEISDELLHGFVKSVTPNGVFVSFGNGLTGLALPRHAVEKPVDDLQKAFFTNQSVACHVIRVDDANKRFLVSMKKETNTTSEPAQNPVDSKMKTLDDFAVGRITKAKVKSIKQTQLNVQLADNLQGRIDVSELFDGISEIKDAKRPLSQFQAGDVLDVKIIGFHDSRNHRFLPISHKRTNQTVLELSAKKSSVLSQKPVVPASIGDFHLGDECTGYINNFARGFLWVTISPNLRARISLMDLSDDASKFENLEKEYPVGSVVRAKVIDLDTEHNILSLSARSKAITSLEDVEVGSVIPARVLKTRESYVVVELGKQVSGISFITDALNDYTDKLDDIFSTNDICAATVLEVDHSNKKVYVSLRTQDVKDKRIASYEDLSPGTLVRGFVKNVADNGVYVALGRTVHALVRVSDLSDSYLKDWKQYFKVHQPVLGKITKCEGVNQILMTLKQSEIDGDFSLLKRFDQIQKDEVYEGSVRRVTNFGVFVNLDGTLNISGLCHHSQIADNPVSNLESLFSEGDRVKVKILDVDREKQQLSLGMKASYFTGETEEPAVEEDEDEVMSDESIIDTAFGHESDKDAESDYSDDTDAQATDGLSAGFDWTASILDQAKEDVSDDDEMEKPRRKKRKVVAEDQTADLNSRLPQSVSDFERLIVGNPDSSILWMNYMSFQIQLSEIDKAREIGERALKTINYREEQEKLNIWIALLNLENMFGTEESLEATFKRSCQYMDPYVMYQKLAAIYTASEKVDQVDQLYTAMCKKFGSQHTSVWVAYGSFLLQQQEGEKAREVLAKALQVLSKRDHVEVVKKFAQLEFSKGDSEHGRSLFEGLLSDVPKRIDLWNVYIDQEIKFGDKKKVESIFERVITRKLSRKQAKFFFGKWLEFEERHEDQKACDYVKAKAVEYAQSLGKE
ncbi:hypothetical protein KL911_002515 [Ogataea haglerorum]|uniref:uncharacterized protein n=1 Tax=Ogataea haglerorum TaxID=1937702 RepID=UPI001C8A129E|nr:uncharacterized protein KL911_002515 [Ogataea haglerorum]KAG7754039.1 hypothetical protein KL911_002515 [Ogataea haglerorum]